MTPRFELPDTCPACGLEGSLVEDDKHFHCPDCGRAWPKSAVSDVTASGEDKPTTSR